MKSVKALIYPYDLSNIHIINFSKPFTKYEIKEVVSPNAWGYVGEDAGFKLGIKTDLSVRDNYDKALENIDTVIILESLLPLDDEHFNQIIDKAIKYDKEVVILRNLKSNYNNDKICTLYATTNEWYESRKNEFENKIKEISKPIVLVLGTGEQTNKFDVQLQVREAFHINNYKVTQIGSKPFSKYYNFHEFPVFMFDDNINTVEKIIRFNHYVEYLSVTEDTDVVVIGVPGGIVPYNDEHNNDFGIINFMVSSAIKPDYVVLNSTFVDYNKDYIELLITSLKYKYEYDINSVFMSNFYINWEVTNSLEKLIYITLKNDYIEKETVSSNVFSVYSEKDKNEFKKHLLGTLIGYGDFTTL